MNDKDMVRIYSDYGYNVYLAPKKRDDYDTKLPARKGNEIEEVEVTWESVKFWVITKRMSLFKDRIVRFVNDEYQNEEELLAELKIRDLGMTRQEKQKLILSTDDKFVNYVLTSKDKDELKNLYGEMVYLTNLNTYVIPEKNRLYLKARMEELDAGVTRTELNPQKTEDVLGIFEGMEIEVAEIVEVKDEPKKATTRKATTKKTTNTARKKATPKK
jgi:hypothetical protein